MESDRWIYDEIYCARCGVHVPVFRDLAPPEQAVIDELLTPIKVVKGDRAIARLTGLSLRQAQIWAEHRNCVHETKGNWSPCPACQRWLNSREAQQCLRCGAKWHGRDRQDFITPPEGLREPCNENSAEYLVGELYRAFGKRDDARLRKLLDQDVVWIQNEGFPGGGGERRGVEAVFEEVFGKFRREWREWSVEIDAIKLVADGRVFVEGSYHGTHEVTGKSMTAAFIHLYTVANGRITMFKQYADTRAIGLAME